MNCIPHRPVVRPIACSLVVAAALVAQDPEARTTAPPTEQPLLVVATNQMELAMGLASTLGYEEAPPDAAEGSHWVVTLRPGGAVTLTTAAGEAPLLDVKADPAGLMQQFADQIEGGMGMLRGALTLGMAPMGIDAKQVDAFTRDLFDFPKQLQRATLRVVGDPESPEQGFDVTLGLVPKAGSPFARTFETLKPAPAGVPTTGKGDAAARVRVSLAPEPMKALLQPFAELTAAMMQHDPEQRTKALALYRRALDLYDGTMCVTVGTGGDRGSYVMGLRDAAAAKELLQSEDFRSLTKTQGLGRTMELEVTPDAVEHRGVQLAKSVATSDGPPNPMMPDGTMEAYSGIAGQFLLGTFGGAVDAAKALVDAALDGTMRREPIPEEAFFDVALDMKAFMAMSGADHLPPDAPERVTMTLGRRGGALQLHVVVE